MRLFKSVLTGSEVVISRILIFIPRKYAMAEHNAWHPSKQTNKLIETKRAQNCLTSITRSIVGKEQRRSGGMRACETLAVFTITRVPAGWPGFTQRSPVLRSLGLGSF